MASSFWFFVIWFFKLEWNNSFASTKLLLIKACPECFTTWIWAKYILIFISYWLKHTRELSCVIKQPSKSVIHFWLLTQQNLQQKIFKNYDMKDHKRKCTKIYSSCVRIDPQDLCCSTNMHFFYWHKDSSFLVLRWKSRTPLILCKLHPLSEISPSTSLWWWPWFQACQNYLLPKLVWLIFHIHICETFCDVDCRVEYDATNCYVNFKYKIIPKGPRDEMIKLWTMTPQTNLMLAPSSDIKIFKFLMARKFRNKEFGLDVPKIRKSKCFEYISNITHK